MSEESVEKVRAGFAAHNRGDLDAWLDLYDPEVEFETLLLGSHQGKEALRSLYEENQANQPGYTATPVTRDSVTPLRHERRSGRWVQQRENPALAGLSLSTPKGSRTPVSGLRIRRPRPLDDGGRCCGSAV